MHFIRVNDHFLSSPCPTLLNVVLIVKMVRYNATSYRVEMAGHTNFVVVDENDAKRIFEIIGVSLD